MVDEKQSDQENTHNLKVISETESKSGDGIKVQVKTKASKE